jgi:tryptophan-rich sensory protein
VNRQPLKKRAGAVHNQQTMPCARDCEYDDELVALYFAGVALIAFLPRLVRQPGTITRYSDYVARLRMAPGIVLFTVVEVLMYCTGALSAVIVRLEGGHYRSDINRISLSEFWILQFVLALYFFVFFNWGYLFLGLLPLLAAVLIAFVVATFFFAVSDVAGVLMYVFASSLVVLFLLSLVIAVHNSDKQVARLTIAMTDDEHANSRKRRAERV